MRITFKNTKTVSIGDKVELNGVLIEVTDDLVKALPALFEVSVVRITTLDGVDIYDGDTYWRISPSGIICVQEMSESMDFGEGIKRFSTKEAAEAHIKSKEVLFTTHDGVQARKGDTVYGCPSLENDMI